MKKGSGILITICLCALCIVVGLFIGRNMHGHYVMLPENQMELSADSGFSTDDFRVEINTASERQLMELPGIGETIAGRIIDYRTKYGPFQTIDDLINVDGIGEKTLQSIESLIKVGG